jgi:hypothetical protein
MAQPTPAERIMPEDKFKPLLMLARRDPVQAAIALTTDGDAIIMLDRHAKPKRVAAMLRTAVAKAKMHLNLATFRFGRIEVDTRDDPTLLRFFINREVVASMRLRLIELVKPYGYPKVQLDIEDALDHEPDDDLAAEDLTQKLVLLTLAIHKVSDNDASLQHSLAALALAAEQALKGGDIARAEAEIEALEAAIQAVLQH